MQKLQRWFGLSAFGVMILETNGRDFAEDICKSIILNENVWILLKISMEFVLKVQINNIPALVQVMAWCRSSII